MTGARVRIEDFKGQIPKRSDRLISTSQAQIARNIRLTSGSIEGMRNWGLLHNFNDITIQKAYRLPDPEQVSQELWVGFNSPLINLYPGPLLNDVYDRYYKFGEGRPQYNTLERLRNGDPYYWLGVPLPVLPGTLGAAGGTAPDEERFYVYTLVSEFQEEGQPSIPVSAIGKEDGIWTLSNMDTSVPNPDEQPILFKNIYRTVAGFTTAEFFFVAQIPIENSAYADSAPSDVIARNNILESTDWAPPPLGLENAVVMPNGFFLAWEGRNIHFSETYRPHAWPAAYDLSTQYEVIGAGVFGQSAGIVTAGHPYFATGTAPENTTLTKHNSAEPGLSPLSIVSLSYGVLYASQNGLSLLNETGVIPSTQDIITKDEWLNDYSPNTLKAAQYEDQWLGFYTENKGISINPGDEQEAFIEFDSFNRVDMIQTDERTGEVYVLRSGAVYLWDDSMREQVAYQWKSKEFYFQKPCNLGAAVIDMCSIADVIKDIENVAIAAREYNTERIKTRLHPIGSSAMGSSYVQEMPAPFDLVPQNRLAIGGSPLIDLAQLLKRNSDVTFTVWADDRIVYSQQVSDKRMIKLPSGFKNDIWTFEVRGRRRVYSITVAETGKGLADV